MKSFFSGLILFVLVLVGIIIYQVGGRTHISVGNIGFVKHLDGSVTEIGQGWPWVGWNVSVQEYPTYMQSLVLSDDPKEGGKDSQQWKVGTADQQELPVNTSLTWKVNVKDATTLFQAVGGKDIDYIRDSIVRPTLKNVTNRVTHNYTWNDIKGKDQAKVTDEINDALKTELAKAGIDLGTFGFTHVGAPAGMEDAQKSLAAAELATKQAQSAQDKAKIENDTKILNAKADAQTVIIGAEAMKAKAQAITQQVIEEEAVQKWDGKLPTYNGGGALPFLNIQGGK